MVTLTLAWFDGNSMLTIFYNRSTLKQCCKLVYTKYNRLLAKRTRVFLKLVLTICHKREKRSNGKSSNQG